MCKKEVTLKKVLKKISYKSLLLEFVSVIFAVLVALGVNEYWKDRSNQQLADKSIKNILIEIKSNQTLLARHHKYHKSMLEKTDSLLSKNSKNEYDLSLKSGILLNTAWKSANIANSILYFDYETITKLTVIYNLQELYAKEIDKLYTLFGSLEFHKTETDILLKSYKFHLKLFLILGDNLLSNYDEFLQENNNL